MNKTEIMALQWMKENNFDTENIIINVNKSPDFICGDQRFEVKKIRKNNLVFYDTQIEKLKDDDIILVFDDNGFKFKFKWGERHNLKDINIIKLKNKVTIQIRKETLKRINSFKISKLETYDEILNRVFSYYAKSLYHTQK